MLQKDIKPNLNNDFSYSVISIIAWAVILGAIEIFVSDLLSAYRLPYRGLIITLYMAIALIMAKFYNPTKFSLLYIVLIIAVMKGFYYQSITHPAIYAVIVEGVIAEIIFLFFGIKYISSLLTGFGLMLYVFLHGWIMHGFYMGKHIFSMYKFIFAELFPWLKISNENIYIIMIISAIVHLVLGLLGGMAAWYLISKAEHIRVKLSEK